MADSKKQFVSVVIPTYHDWDRLQLCLDALRKQTYSSDWFEIIVVNNAINSLKPESFSFPPNCKFISEIQPGSYAARNAGVHTAEGEFILFTDSDCIPEVDWIEKAVNFLEINPDYDRVGGNIKIFTENKKATLVEIYEKAYAFQQSELVSGVGAAVTANMITRKSVFDEVGMFNESLFSGGDVEWGKRAQNFFKKIQYLDDCIVWHPARTNFKAIKQKIRRVSGGHFVVERNKGVVFLLLNMAISLLPPVKSIYRLFIYRHDMTIKEKILASIVRYYLRFIAFGEKVRLLLGKQCERQ